MNAQARQTLHSVKLLKFSGLGSRRTRIPQQRWPKLVELEYAKALIARMNVARSALNGLLHALPGLLDRARASRRVDRRDTIDVLVTQLLPEKYLIIDGVDTAIRFYKRPYRRLDASEDNDLEQIMRAVRARLEQAVNPVDVKELAQKFAERTQSVQRIALGKQVKAALGADVFGSDKRIPALRDHFITENVALIKSIPSTVLNEVEGIVSRAFTDATPHDVVAKQIEQRFGVGESRARLIARDQIGKLYGQTNAYRQQDLGIESFIWRTVGDERVRDEHEALEGQEFRYDDPPDEGLPGEPIQCRCSAEPVFGNLLNAEDDTETAPPEPEPEKETPRTREPFSLGASPPPANYAQQQHQQAQQRAIAAKQAQEAARLEAERAQQAHEQAISEVDAAQKAIDELVAQRQTELEQQHTGFRIGVTSEITGSTLPDVPQHVPAIEAIKQPLRPLPLEVPTLAAAVPPPEPEAPGVTLTGKRAPAGFEHIEHKGSEYYRHVISQRAYTKQNLLDIDKGHVVELNGPNVKHEGFQSLEVDKELRHRSIATGAVYTPEQIASGDAARIETERLKPDEPRPNIFKRFFGSLVGK